MAVKFSSKSAKIKYKIIPVKGRALRIVYNVSWRGNAYGNLIRILHTAAVAFSYASL